MSISYAGIILRIIVCKNIAGIVGILIFLAT